jgi:hypothetical protein
MSAMNNVTEEMKKMEENLNGMTEEEIVNAVWMELRVELRVELQMNEPNLEELVVGIIRLYSENKCLCKRLNNHRYLVSLLPSGFCVVGKWGTRKIVIDNYGVVSRSRETFHVCGSSVD